MLCSAQRTRLVPGLSGRNNVQAVEFKLLDGRSGERNVCMMRGVESAAEYADTVLLSGLDSPVQTHSRLTRNSLYKRSSAEPASTWR